MNKKKPITPEVALNQGIEDLEELIEIQGRKEIIDQGEYMLGIYNGMVLALSLFIDNPPVFKNAPKKLQNGEKEDKA